MFFYETLANSCCGNYENTLYSSCDTREVIAETNVKAERPFYEVNSIDVRQLPPDRTKDDEDKEEIGLKGAEFLPGAARQKLSERSFDPIDSLSGPHEEYVDEISRSGIEIRMDNGEHEPVARASSAYVEEEVPRRREASDVYVENHPSTRQEPERRQEPDEVPIRSKVERTVEFGERTVEFHETPDFDSTKDGAELATSVPDPKHSLSRPTKKDINKRRSILEMANAGLIFDVLGPQPLEEVLAEHRWVYHEYPPDSLITIQGDTVPPSGPAIFVMTRGEVIVHHWEPEDYAVHESALRKKRVGISHATPLRECCYVPPQTRIVNPEALKAQYGPPLASYYGGNKFFGPCAGMLDGDKWHVTLVAMTRTTVWYLNKEIFDALVKAPLAAEMERRRGLLHPLSFYRALSSDTKRECVVEGLKLLSVEEGEVLLDKGEKINKMLFVHSGRAMENKMAGDVYVAGDVIGEQAMATTKRTLAESAIITIGGPFEALVLDRYTVYDYSKSKMRRQGSRSPDPRRKKTER